MDNTTPWSLLRAANAEQQQQGLRLIQEAHALNPDASHIMELGVALLWLGQYASAWDHFQEALKEYPIKGDAFYGMAGVAKWCLGEPGEAISQWHAGLKAKYARANGLGVIMPLLLFFASVVRPGLLAKSSVEQLILEKITDPRIKTWPGPIAKLASALVTEDDFQKQCKGESDRDTANRLWLTEFYRNVLRHDPQKHLGFKQAMSRLTDTSQPEWSDEDDFLTRIWCEEFFLARHEAT